VYSPAIGSMSLPCRFHRAPALCSVAQRLLDEFGLAFLDHKNRLLAFAELEEFVIDQRDR
jgi:hypothetical protein